MTRALALGFTIGGALALTACAPPHPHAAAPMRVISRLDCPNEEGDLKIIRQAGDGSSCVYTDAQGSEVDVSLIKLAGASAQSLLTPIETALQTEVPDATLTATKHLPSGNDDDNVNIDVPGVHIHANENGDANVQTPGATVTASSNGNAVVRAQGVSVEANDSRTRIRIDDSGPGVRSKFLLVANNPGPHGYRFVGYIARGPAGGPLVVAQVKGRTDDRDMLDHDVSRLVEHNLGS